MNDLEKEFVSSLNALLKRYSLVVSKEGYSIEESDIEWIFSNDSEERETEIYLNMDEIHKEIVKDVP